MSSFEDSTSKEKKPKKEKKESAKDRRARKEAEKNADSATTDTVDVNIQDLSLLQGGMKMTEEQMRVATARSVTGVLSSSEEARDVKFDSFSLMVGGNQLVTDCHVELNQGCRYGLIGLNGSGKSNVLAALAQREVPLPSHIDIYHLHEEAPANELSGVEAVIAHIVEETQKLEELSERIMEEFGADDERLEKIFERIDELDPSGSEPRARLILSGLGFCDRLIPMDRKTKHMSGGWRMRVSLAKALFAAPSLLLLGNIIYHLSTSIHFLLTYSLIHTYIHTHTCVCIPNKFLYYYYYSFTIHVGDNEYYPICVHCG
jgi:ATP-binding cassette subfamily F protein 2